MMIVLVIAVESGESHDRRFGKIKNEQAEVGK